MKLKSNTRKRKFIFKGKHLILGVVTIIVLLLPFLLSNLQKIKFKSKPRADFEVAAEPLIEYKDGQQCDNEGQYQVQCKGPPETCNGGGGFVGKVINCRKNSTGELRWVFYTECVEKEEYLRGGKYNCSRENFAPIDNNPPEKKNDDVVETVQNTTEQNLNLQTMDAYKKYPCNGLVPNKDECVAIVDSNGKNCHWETYKNVDNDNITGCVSNEFYDKVYCHFNNEEDCNKSNSPVTRCEWRLYSDNGLDKYGCRRIDWPEFTPIPKLDQPCNTYTSQEYCETLHSVNNQLQRNCMWSNDGGACYDLADSTVTTGNATSTQNSVWDNINAMLRRMLQR